MSSMSDLRSRAEKMRQEFFKDDVHKDWFSGHNIFIDEKIQNFFNDERKPDVFTKSQKHQFSNNSKKEDFYQHTSEGNLDEFEKLKQRILDKRSFPWHNEWGHGGNVEIKRNDYKSHKDEETKSSEQTHKNMEDDDDFSPIPNGQRRKSLDNLFSKIRDLKCEFQNVEKKLRNAREDLPKEYQDTTSEPGHNRGQHQHHFDNLESQSSRSWIRRAPEEEVGPYLYRKQHECNKEPTSSRTWMQEPSEWPHRRGHQKDELNSGDTQSSRSWARRPSGQDNLSWRSDKIQGNGTNRDVTTQTSTYASNSYTDTKPPFKSRFDNTSRTEYTNNGPRYDNSNESNISNFENISNLHSLGKTKQINASHDETLKTYTRLPNKTATDCDEYGISAERRRLKSSDYYPGKISGYPPPSGWQNKSYTSSEQASALDNIYQNSRQNKIIPVKINLVHTTVKGQLNSGEYQNESNNEDEEKKDLSTIISHQPSALHCNQKQMTDDVDEFTSAVSSPTYPFQSDVSSNTTSIQTPANPQEPIGKIVNEQKNIEGDCTLYQFPEYDAKEKSPSSYTETLSGISSPIYGLGTVTEISESHSGVSSAMDGTLSGVSSAMDGTLSGVSSPTYSMGTETHSRVCSPSYESETATDLSDTHSRIMSPSHTEFSEIESGLSEHSELESSYKTATDCSTSQPSSSSLSSDSLSGSEKYAYHVDFSGEGVISRKEELSGNIEKDDVHQTKIASTEYEKGEDNIQVKDESMPNQEKILEPSLSSKESVNISNKGNSPSGPKKEMSPLNPKQDEQLTNISVNIEQATQNPTKLGNLVFTSDRTRKYSPDPGYNSNSSSSTIRSPSLCHSETYIQMPVVHSGVKGRVLMEKRVVGSWEVSWSTVVREQQVSWDKNNLMDGNNRIRMGDDKFSWTAVEYIY